MRLFEAKFSRGSLRIKLIPYWVWWKTWPPTDPTGWAEVTGVGFIRFLWWPKEILGAKNGNSH